MTQPPRDIHELMTAGAVQKPVLQLGQMEKEEWGSSDRQFTLTDGAYDTDEKNGPFMQFAGISVDQPISFRLYFDGNRDGFLESVANALADGPIAGFRLRTYSGKGPNKRVELEPA